MTTLLRIGILIQILWSVLDHPGYGQHGQMVVNLTNPSASGYLNFTNPKGSVKVTGYNGDVVIITAIARFDNDIRNDGAQKIPVSKLFSADEKNNRISVYCTETNKTLDFDIKIPRNFSMRISSLDNGTIEIINIKGDVEASNPAGDIVLESISGSAVVNTVSGKIVASFSRTAVNSPMVFTSLEGNIELYLPENTNAQVKLRSQNGKLLSDFNIVPLKQTDNKAKGTDYRLIASEGWTVGMINNGGPEYMISTFNGNINLKKNRNIQ